MFFLQKKETPLREFIPQGYVDIHSHLLPGIDDGVQTIFQSAYIIEQFEKMGIERIITTPHIMQDVWPNTTAIIQDKLQSMQHTLKTLGINITLESGAEYMLDDLFVKRVKNKDILPIQGKYLLVEMSTFNPPIHLNEILFDLKVAGYIPVLAHPERYSFYHDDLKHFEELKAAGVLFQLNLLSLSGYYGENIKATALKLLGENLYDFTGSDIHNFQQYQLLEKGFNNRLSVKIAQIMKNNCFF